MNPVTEGLSVKDELGPSDFLLLKVVGFVNIYNTLRSVISAVGLSVHPSSMFHYANKSV